MSEPYRSALLLGEEQTAFGELAQAHLTPQLTIAISRGRFPKPYAHVDPNEDAAFAATNGTTTVIAVADGHNGFDAAKAAITAVDRFAREVIEYEPGDALTALVNGAVESVRPIAALEHPRNASRTAMTICVSRSRSVAVSTFGDTACLAITGDDIRRIGGSAGFLGHDTNPETAQVTLTEVPKATTFVVASDGLLDYADAKTFVAATSDERPGGEALVRAAFAGGAGDHIAVAVFRSD